MSTGFIHPSDIIMLVDATRKTVKNMALCNVVPLLFSFCVNIDWLLLLHFHKYVHGLRQ
jgi:hypothetical protein